MCLLSLNQYILRDNMLNWYNGILSDQKEEKKLRLWSFGVVLLTYLVLLRLCCLFVNM